jgi:hypothetical protein
MKSYMYAVLALVQSLPNFSARRNSCKVPPLPQTVDDLGYCAQMANVGIGQSSFLALLYGWLLKHTARVSRGFENG